MHTLHRGIWILSLVALAACGTTEEQDPAADAGRDVADAADTGSDAGDADVDDVDDADVTPDTAPDVPLPLCPTEDEVRAAAAQAHVGPEVPCGLPDEVPLDGLVHCEQGLTWRAHAGLCAEPWEPGPFAGSCQEPGENTCSEDSDCAGGPFAHCTQAEDNGVLLDCQCNYGCRCDADCPQGQVCGGCACVTANCETNADCGDYACALSAVPFAEPAFHCKGPNDTCATDADCDQAQDCERCVFTTDKWECRFVCGD